MKRNVIKLWLVALFALLVPNSTAVCSGGRELVFALPSADKFEYIQEWRYEEDEVLTEERIKELIAQEEAVAVKQHKASKHSPKYDAKAIFEKEYNKYRLVDKRELLALSTALYCEARGEPWLGIASVADTIRNRKESRLFPDTYYGVVTQRSQFSCIKDRNELTNNIRLVSKPDVVKFKKLIKMANRTLTGKLHRMTYGALFYHTTAIKPFWAKKYNKLGTIGNHVFYTTRRL